MKTKSRYKTKPTVLNTVESQITANTNSSETMEATGDDITSLYLNLTRKYQSTYGKKTVVLLQVGAFFEIYGLKNANTGEIFGSVICEISQLCNLNMSEKKIELNGHSIFMAGFRDYSLDKYLQRLSELGYTCIVYVQEMEGGKVERRVLREIVSPGTYLSYESDVPTAQYTNHIMCIWIEPTGSRRQIEPIGQRMIYGAATIDIFTGKSAIFEQEIQEMTTTSLDELERFVSTYSPTEVIFIHRIDSCEVSRAIQYAGIRTDKIHLLDMDNIESSHPTYVKLENATKQTYIKHMLTKQFGVDTYSICGEFQTYLFATQAFCYLLNFIQEHNPNLVERIGIPIFQNTSNCTILANHTLKQLNIVDDASADGRRAGNLSSVFAFVNKCCTVMGKRKLYTQITHPIFDSVVLNKEYDMISWALESENNWSIDFIRKQFAPIRDMEKFCRNLLVGKLTPNSIYQLYENMATVHQTNECFAEHPKICAYFCRDFTESLNSFEIISETSTAILKYLETRFVMEYCKSNNGAGGGSDIDTLYIARGFSTEYDDMVDSYQAHIKQFQAIHAYLNSIMQRASQKPGAPQDTTEYIKIHETEKSGYSLQLTKKRAGTLKPILTELAKTGMAKFAVSEDGPTIDFQDAKLVAASASAEEIHFHQLSTICRSIQTLKEEIGKKQTEIFATILKEIVEKWYTALQNIASYIATADVLQSKAYVAKTYGYCRPHIREDAAKSFVSVRGLRHCLIEHLNTDETYVANDLDLGLYDSKPNVDGVLLYGTNAVGKTSFIRSLGIAVILAQSGCFVPCSQFIYKPYTAIYSRILGNDNIFKGLSTFAVEMSELRLILKMADENSLILGDELCSGTETESALAIFMAGLLKIHSARASFLFATHFHEILRFSEMGEMPNLACMHMAVEYNRELDCLVYDRKLREGSGNRMYGLEVCRSLHLSTDFLEKAYELRNKYYPDTRGSLSLPTTTYNAKKVRDMCEMCGMNLGTETHHLLQQKEADTNGRIGGIHKNHLGNLASICESCHQKEHSTDTRKEKTGSKKKTTAGKIAIL
jgi:DNA mismatch repair protein MutS